MALDKTSMAQMRIAELAQAYPDMPMSGDIYNEMIKYFEADSSGIIKDLIANAVILPGSFSNGGGPVTGAGKVT